MVNILVREPLIYVCELVESASECDILMLFLDITFEVAASGPIYMEWCVILNGMASAQ